MDMFHGGGLAAMPPNLVNDEGDVMVFRLLALYAKGRPFEVFRRHEVSNYPV